MDSFNFFLFGDLRITVALAGVVAAWLLASRCYRMAMFWCLVFSATLGVVAMSKIIFLGWGIRWTMMDFKAISGHAAGAALVLPPVCYLLTVFLGQAAQNIAFVIGWLLSAAVTVSLVATHEHSLSDALAGLCFGTLASIATRRALRTVTIHPELLGLAMALPFALALALVIPAVPVNWWLRRVAMALAGVHQTHSWIG